MAERDKLYIFIDESGNFDFSRRPGASRWFVLSVLSTTDPTEGVAELIRVRHEAIEQGLDIERFHATEDRQRIRDKVFSIMGSLDRGRIDSIAVDKPKLHLSLREPRVFYPRMLEYVLKYVFHPYGAVVRQFDHVSVMLSRFKPPKGQKHGLERGIKTFLKSQLPGVPYSLVFHQDISHPYLQLADYASWAIYVARERGENRPRDAIAGLIKSEFEIFEHGRTNFY